MPGNPKECRQHAENCRRLAAEARSVGARNNFLNLADNWERLAIELETVQPLIKVMKEIEFPAHPATPAE
jgi:hypothetical protein